MEVKLWIWICWKTFNTPNILEIMVLQVDAIFET